MRWFASCYAKPLWWRLGVGVAAALLGAVLRLAFVGLLENRLVYVTFYPAVEVAALLGGIASGGVTTVICALLAHRWVTPIANLGDWLGLAIFLTMARRMRYSALYRPSPVGAKATLKAACMVGRSSGMTVEKTTSGLTNLSGAYPKISRNSWDASVMLAGTSTSHVPTAATEIASRRRSFIIRS